MRTITIRTDVSKDYFEATEALEDKGYKVIGTVEFSGHTRTLLSKNGKEYYYAGMEHCNTTIYSVSIVNVDDIDPDLYPFFQYNRDFGIE